MVMALDPQLVQDLLQTARQRGATAGDALLVDNESFEVQVRLGEVDKVQQSHQKRLGLRLFFGHRSATTSTSDLSEASLRQLLDDTCALAQAMAEDPQSGLPEPGETIATTPDLQLWDDAIARLPVEERTTMAREAEQAALHYDSRITNSEGGEYGSSQSHVLYANSHGLVGQYRAGSASLSCQAGLAARCRLDKHHTKTLIVAVDLTVGHGKHIAGIHPARQVGLAHCAYPVGDAFCIMFRDQAVEVVGIFTDSRDDVAQRDAFGA